jgi:hydroxymethylbilane synthase
VETDGQLHLDAVVLSGDGAKKLSASGLGEPKSAEALGRQVAEELISQGATELIQACRVVR